MDLIDAKEAAKIAEDVNTRRTDRDHFGEAIIAKIRLVADRGEFGFDVWKYLAGLLMPAPTSRERAAIVDDFTALGYRFVSSEHDEGNGFKSYIQSIRWD